MLRRFFRALSFSRRAKKQAAPGKSVGKKDKKPGSSGGKPTSEKEKETSLDAKLPPEATAPGPAEETKPPAATTPPPVEVESGPSPAQDRLLFVGDYPTWDEACASSLGYDAPLIFEKTRVSIGKVARGEAVFERDSVLFEVPEYPFSTIAGLLHVACARGGELSVLDFGGSLGSVYFACRPWLDTVSRLRWSVVEQPHYVECGRKEFANDSLMFHHTLEESVAWQQPDVILLSGSMHFLPDAVSYIEKICRTTVPYVLLERTPFWDGDRHRIVIQHVPAEIYPASYACWLFCERLLLRQFGEAYDVTISYPAMDVIPLEGGRSYFKGLLFRRKAER